MELLELEVNQQALSRREKRKPSSKKFCISFIHAHCKACGLCVEACPAGVLALYDDPENKWGVAVRTDSLEYCTGCRSCEMQCPDFAIFVNEGTE